MATIKRFEDLESWHLARQLAKSIYEITLQDNFSREFKLKDQMKGSSGSVMDNIAVPIVIWMEEQAGLNSCNFSLLLKGP